MINHPIFLGNRDTRHRRARGGQNVKKTAGSHPEFISGSHEMKFQS